jgi:hypothetical protein
MPVATGSWTDSVRPSLKLITPTATATATAVAKTLVLRITLFPQYAKAVPWNDRHDQPKLVNFQFVGAVQQGSGSSLIALIPLEKP